MPISKRNLIGKTRRLLNQLDPDEFELVKAKMAELYRLRRRRVLATVRKIGLTVVKGRIQRKPEAVMNNNEKEH